MRAACGGTSAARRRWRRAARSSNASVRPWRSGASRKARRVVATASVLKSTVSMSRSIGAVASGASRLVERLNAGVPFIGWPCGPFPMGGVRRDSRYTDSVHGVAPFYEALGATSGRKLHTGRCGGVARTATDEKDRASNCVGSARRRAGNVWLGDSGVVDRSNFP